MIPARNCSTCIFRECTLCQRCAKLGSQCDAIQVRSRHSPTSSKSPALRHTYIIIVSLDHIDIKQCPPLVFVIFSDPSWPARTSNTWIDEPKDQHTPSSSSLLTTKKTTGHHLSQPIFGLPYWTHKSHYSSTLFPCTVHTVESFIRNLHSKAPPRHLVTSSSINQLTSPETAYHIFPP